MRIFIILLFVLFTFSGYSQDPIMSLYRSSQLWHNPAFAGADENQRIGLSGRHNGPNWIVDRFLLASYDIKIPRINAGVGITLLFDEWGGSRTKVVGLNYSYHLYLADETYLMFGSRVVYSNKTIDADFGIVGSAIRLKRADLDFGLLFEHKNFYLGTSSLQLFNTNFAGYGTFYSYGTHYYISSGYKIPISENWTLEPSFIIRIIHPIRFSPNFGLFRYNTSDLTLTATVKSKFKFGLSIRATQNISPLILLAGINLNDELSIDIAADMNFDSPGHLKLSRFKSVQAALTYNIKKKPYHITIPRF